MVASTAPHLGAKLRDGKLEVKILGESRDLLNQRSGVEGRIQNRTKWSWIYAWVKDVDK